MRLRLCGLFSFVMLALLGCSSFHSLHQNVKTIDKSFPEYSISISNMSYQSPVVIVQLRSLDPLDVLSVDSTSRSNTLQLSAFDQTHYLLVFEDLDSDFIMQSNEPSQLIDLRNWHDKARANSNSLSVTPPAPSIEIVLAQNDDQFEAPFIGVNFIFKLNIELKKAAIGRSHHLDQRRLAAILQILGCGSPQNLSTVNMQGYFFCKPMTQIRFRYCLSMA
ncbi:hypothetical protein AS132_21835 [Photobacterium sanguinicancri]|nr:hypothetical protein AS132_21835 [Photobacterium sanguinicancri]